MSLVQWAHRQAWTYKITAKKEKQECERWNVETKDRLDSASAGSRGVKLHAAKTQGNKGALMSLIFSLGTDAVRLSRSFFFWVQEFRSPLLESRSKTYVIPEGSRCPSDLLRPRAPGVKVSGFHLKYIWVWTEKRNRVSLVEQYYQN